jgi:hypothetical protein
MRTIIVTLTLVFFLTPAVISAQVTDAVELSRQIIKTQKQAIVAESMNLTEEEAQAFWPVYKDYQEGLRRINDQYVAFIRDYAGVYRNLTTQQAQDMIKEYLDIESDRLKLKKSYRTKFGKVLSPTKLIRYYQIENKIEAVIKYNLATETPLATEVIVIETGEEKK